MSLEARPIFLVGFMGSGKSSVAGALAGRLSRRFVDLDRLIEERERRPIGRLIEAEGEPRFRRMERDALLSLDDAPAAVVATGGGLFASHDNRAWIRARGVSVWLDVPLAVARRRVGDAPDRPLWTSGDPVGLRALFDRRRAAYALADLRADAAVGDPERVAAWIASRLEAIFR